MVSYEKAHVQKKQIVGKMILLYMRFSVHDNKMFAERVFYI